MDQGKEQTFEFAKNTEDLSQLESDYLEQLSTMETLTNADYEAFAKVGKGRFPKINAWAKDRLKPDVMPAITGIPKGKEFEEGGIYQRREEFNLKLARIRMQAGLVSEMNKEAVNKNINPKTESPEALALLENREAEKQQTINFARQRYGDEVVDGWLSNPIGFGETGDFTSWSEIIPGGGFVQGYDALEILSISEKLKKGEIVPDADSKKLNDYVDNVVEMDVRGMTFGGKFAYYGGQMPAFMLEFMATGGYGKAAQTAITKGAVEVSKKRAVAGATARVATQSALLMPSQGAKHYGNLRLNGEWEVTDTGRVIINEAKEAPATSALKAFGYVSAEVAAELSGVGAAKLLKTKPGIKVTSALKKSSMIAANKLPTKLKTGLFKAYQKVKPNASINEMFTKAGWNGMLFELGEERVADILRETVDLALTEGYTMDDVLQGITPDAEQLLLEAGLIATVGSAKAGSSVAVNILIERGMPPMEAMDAVEALSSSEVDAIVDKELTLDTSSDVAVEPDLVTVFDFQDLVSQESIAEVMGEQFNDDQLVSDSQQIELIDKALLEADKPYEGEVDLTPEEQQIQEEVELDTKAATESDNKTDDALIDLEDIKIIVPTQYTPLETAAVETVAVEETAAETAAETVAAEEAAIEETTVEEAPLLAENQSPTNQTVSESESIFSPHYYEWVDDLGALVDVGKEAAKRGQKNLLNRFVRLYSGVTGHAIQALTKNTFIINREGKTVLTGRGLKSILDDFDGQIIESESNSKQREKDLKDYLIARRVTEDLAGREDVEISEDQARDAVNTLIELNRKYGNEFEVFETTAKEIYGFQDRMLRLLVSSGSLSNEAYLDIKKLNPNYIPMKRVLDSNLGEDAGQKVKFEGRAGSVIKKIKGSDKEIVDPIESIFRNTFRIADVAAQNNIMTELVSLESTMPEYIQRWQGDARQARPRNVFDVMVNGKRRMYKLDPFITKSMETFQPEIITGVTWLLQAPARVLRRGATIVPDFIARNFIRDTLGALVLAEGRPNPIDVVKGLLHRVGKTEVYDEWMRSGGAMSYYMDMRDDGAAKAVKELLDKDGRLVKALKNPLLPFDTLGQYAEHSVRIGTFIAAKRKGLSDADAGMASRDASIDFNRGGSSAKQINKYIPFFNASIQGTDKTIRRFKENPKAFVMWGAGTVTLPSVMLTGYYLYLAPDEEKKEYLEIPQWQRDLFWVFKKGDTWVRIPKPFGIGYAFGSMPERFMVWSDGSGNDDGLEMFKEVMAGMYGSFSPITTASGVLPPPIKVAVEQLSKYDFFRSRRIYPEFMDDLPPEQRFTDYTSETAKLLGKQLEYSPALIESAMKGSLATSANYVLGAGDFLINEVNKFNGDKLPETPKHEDVSSLYKSFTVDPYTGSSESLSAFYEALKESTQAKRGFDNLKSRKEKAAFKKENQAWLRSHYFLNKAGKSISRQNKAIKKIRANMYMTPEQKSQSIELRKKTKLRLARQANEKLAKRLSAINDKK